ncbi:hypothetical protein BYT27DRAFT_7075454, partial [Phlegmacium glaucopus]
ISSTWSASSNLSNLSKTEDLTLFCWILNVSNNPFAIDIGQSMRVDHLKKAIKKEKRHTFEVIESDTLELWKLSTPIPSTEIGTKLRDAQSPQQIQGCVKLDPIDKLSAHFSPDPRNHLHILVEAPPTRKCSRNFSTSILMPVNSDCH